MTGFPLILTRSQNRAHPLSCDARITVGADDVVIQVLVPDYFALFVGKSSDSTSESGSASSSSVVEESQSGAKRSWLADELSESESDDESDDDRGDDFGSTFNDDEQKPDLVIHLTTSIALLQEGMAAKTVITPAPFLSSTYFLFSNKYLELHLATKNLSSLACSLLNSAKRNCRTCTVLVSQWGEYLILTTPSRLSPNCLCLREVLQAEALTKI